MLFIDVTAKNANAKYIISINKRNKCFYCLRLSGCLPTAESKIPTCRRELLRLITKRLVRFQITVVMKNDKLLLLIKKNKYKINRHMLEGDVSGKNSASPSENCSEFASVQIPAGQVCKKEQQQ